MSKIYSIESTQENKMIDCCSFEMQEQDVFNNYSTYHEVLKLFREAFKMVDFSQIIGKS